MHHAAKQDLIDVLQDALVLILNYFVTSTALKDNL